jgi:hypothetical protein
MPGSHTPSAAVLCEFLVGGNLYAGLAGGEGNGSRLEVAASARNQKSSFAERTNLGKLGLRGNRGDPQSGDFDSKPQVRMMAGSWFLPRTELLPFMVFFVDPLHIAIALFPLAMYLLALGAINLSSRPLLTTGVRDTLALGIAVSGCVIAGPMELFLPESAATLYGGWVWAMMLSCYALFVLFIALMLRPRLVIYNITLEQLMPVLEETIARLDKQVRASGNTMVSQELGVQFSVESQAMVKNVQIIAAGPVQSLAGWRRLETELAAALRSVRGTPNPYGASLLTFGLLIAGLITLLLYRDAGSVQQSLADMLRQ